MSAPASIAQTLAGFAAGLEYDAIPAPVVAAARLRILDAIGVALAASAEDYARVTVEALADFGAGDAVVIGFARRLPLRDAVVANGALVHGIDFDDTHLAGVIHPSASALPTALAVAADRQLSGRDLLLAYVLAVEAGARLGAVARGELNQLGFHATGVVAAFACALAAGRLYGLTAVQLTMAQGIALSMAAGTREYSEDGAWTKRLHPGWAGAAGITAAGLARRGFVGPVRAYEGRFGFYATHLGTHGRAYDLPAATAALGQRWEIEDVAVKPLPACQLSIAAIDAALALARAPGFDPRAIAAVTVRISPHAVAIVCEPEAAKRRPGSTYAAQFSLHYVVACALLRGRFGLAELSGFADPDLLQLADRISYEVDPGDGRPHFGGEVIVTLHDGRRLVAREPVPRGAPGNPVTADAIQEKFLANAGLVVAPGHAREILDQVLGLDRLADARVLADRLTMAR